jgi:ABC-type branched-subunit amino acid transport system permease subunit
VAFVYVVKEVLRARMHDLLRGAGGEHELIAYGVILVLIMIFMPEGLTVGIVNLLQRLQRRLGERRKPQLQEEAAS